MQKKIAFIIVGITVMLTVTIMCILLFTTQDKGDKMPQPVVVNERQMEDAGHKLQKEAWIEQMHLAAPGTDWKKMDADLRWELAKKSAANWYNSGIRGGEWDTIAGGYAIGKWAEVGSYNTAGRVRATEYDPITETVYAFSQGGNLWKGDLDGSNWSVINDKFNIQSAHFLRKLDDMLIVATNEWATQSVYRTFDEGISWEACIGLENMTSWGSIVRTTMLNDSLHTLYALVQEWDYVDWGAITSIYRSIDSGSTFSLVKSYDEATYGSTTNVSMWSSRYGNSLLYISINDALYVLEPGSDDPVWTGSIPISVTGGKILCGMEKDGITHLYLSVSDYVEGTYFYASDDGGENWVEKGNLGEGYFSKTSFNCSQKDVGQLWFGGVNTYRSSNAGDSWTTINEWWEYYGAEETQLHADIPFIQSYFDVVSDEEIMLISTDGGLFKSTNAGLTNQNITMTGMRNAQYYDAYTFRDIPEYIFAGAQDQGFQRSFENIDGKYNFDQLISGDYGHIVSSNGGDKLWTVYPGFAMEITDAPGAANMYFWDFIGSGYLWLPPIVDDPDNPDACWWGGGDHLYKLTRTFSSINYEIYPFDFAPGLSSAAIAAIAYSPLNTDYWYVLMSDGGFYYSTDHGDNWEMTLSFDGPGSHYFYGSSIVPSRSDLGTVYIGGSGYSNPAVYKSTDNGLNFSDMSTGLPSTLVYDMAIMPGDSLLFAATEVAPYVYVPENDMWYDLSGTDAPYQTYWGVEYIDTIHTARFVTYGRGIFDFNMYFEPEIPPLGIAGHQMKTMELYPNPVRNSLYLKSPENIMSATVQIFSLDGQQVLQKKNLTMNKGIPYNLELPTSMTGTYLVRIEGNGMQWIEKICVID